MKRRLRITQTDGLNHAQDMAQKRRFQLDGWFLRPVGDRLAHLGNIRLGLTAREVV